MGSRWLTNSDVLKDVADINELDMYCVLGERAPPPRRSSIEDEEINNQFYGGMHNRGLDYDVQENAPDLMGIQKMLQWVQQEDVSLSYSDEKLKQNRRIAATSVISIRKIVNKNNYKSKPSKFAVNNYNRNFKPGQSSNANVNFSSNPVDVSTFSKYPEGGVDFKKTDIVTCVPIASNEDLNMAQNLISLDSKKSTTQLNPNVPEFIPKSCAVSEKASNSVDKAAESIVNTPIIELKEQHTKNEPDVSKNSDVARTLELNKEIDVNKLNSDEIKLISDKLKSTILEASKENTYASKKARNVAMAALLKLHTSPAAEVSGEKKQPLLLPPKFFESASCEINSCMEILNGTKNKTERVAVNKEATSTGMVELKNETVRDNPMKEINDKHILLSIAKVNNWLYGEEKMAKPKGPILTPVTFKKKESISPKKVETEKNEQSSSPSLLSNSFVPSEHAKDLFEKFTENAKKIENSSLNVWDKLICDLEEKDEAIRRKRKERDNPTYGMVA